MQALREKKTQGEDTAPSVVPLPRLLLDPHALAGFHADIRVLFLKVLLGSPSKTCGTRVSDSSSGVTSSPLMLQFPVLFLPFSPEIERLPGGKAPSTELETFPRLAVKDRFRALKAACVPSQSSSCRSWEDTLYWSALSRGRTCSLHSTDSRPQLLSRCADPQAQGCLCQARSPILLLLPKSLVLASFAHNSVK